MSALALVLSTATLPDSLAHAASSCGATVNPIVCENQKPGTDPAEWDITEAGDPSIQGFASDISVNAGQRIDFKVDTDARSYAVKIYRTGWYQGLGARYLTTVNPSAALPQRQPECISDVTTELYDCGNWGVSASWTVPADAVSGVYIARLVRADTGGDSHILFIVRNDGNRSDIVFQTSDPTWQAYNPYGGSDFYQGAANGRAYKISYNRPITTRGTFEHRSFFFSAEYATVRFLERNGYDVSYLAGVDTDRRGGELLNHDVFLSVGHDEYWSGAQRRSMEAARDAGVNMQFLSGNEGYWRTRYEPSADSSRTAYRTLVSYKESWSNAKIDPSAEWTGTWRDPRFADAQAGGHLPENALTGTMYTVNDISAPLTVSGREGRLRLWRNTGLSSMAADATVNLGQGIIGYESDEDVDNGFRPQGLIRLSTTNATTSQYMYDYGSTVAPGTTRHNLTLYRAPSGALVFSAGSVQWGWGLDDYHDGTGSADQRLQQAQVNLLADMGALPGSLMPSLSRATTSTDTTPPATVITSPVEGQPVPNGTTVTMTGTASDVGGRVAGVEVSTDGGATWRAAAGTTDWSFTYVQQGDGPTALRARAIDDSANYSTAGATRMVQVGGPYSAFGSQTPAIASADDGQSVELGVRFTPAVDGFVSAIRFYKGAANTGTHTGSLWSSSGERMGSVLFRSESPTGWQTAEFAAPLAVRAGTVYTASYTAPAGGYAIETMHWPYAARASSPVVVASGVGGAAPGVYGAPGRRPESTWSESNYFVDVVFTKSDLSPLRVLTRTPAAGSSSVAPGVAVSATFTRPADPASVSMGLATAGGEVTPGTTSFDPATNTVRFAPSSPLSPATAYVVSLTAKDTHGVGLSDAVWGFTTRAEDRDPADCPCSLFPESRTPSIASETDGARVVVGVGFTPTVSGRITALRFYKGESNTGAHIGALWSTTGQKLAEVAFDSESTSGWQLAQLPTPVTVTAGTRYVVSYLAPDGGYSVTPGGFSSAYARGPLTVAAGDAVFTYEGDFPRERSTTDYGVDVVFEPEILTPAIVQSAPADGAGGILSSTAVTATFNTAIAPTFQGVVTADGTAVDGAWTLSPDDKTAIFAPAAPFPDGARVSVGLRGIVSTQGRTGADVGWTFSVAAQPVAPVTLLGSRTPLSAEAAGTASVELGMAFTVSIPGQVSAIRFYKDAGNTGTHVGTLWDATGTRLAEVTFAGETGSGWQRAAFSTPVSLTPGTTYTVSYLAPRGGYSFTAKGFATAVTSGPLTAVTVQNGRYRYGSGGVMPTAVWNSTNYFVDVEFVPGAGSPDPVPRVTSMSPAAGATGVSTSSTISAVLDQDPGTRAVSLVLTGPEGEISGTAAYAASTRRVTFAPASALRNATAYTATITLGGLALDSWRFQTAEAPVSAEVQSLFGSSEPSVTEVAETAPVEVGTVFTVARGARATAIRFYKARGDTAAHRATLWGPDGTILAQVAFVDETAEGWQRAALSSPVALEPGIRYTVSYFSPGGKYAYTPGYFAQDRVVGDITGVSPDNGRFLYGSDGGMPTSSWNSTAYFVDAEVDLGSPPAAATIGDIHWVDALFGPEN